MHMHTIDNQSPYYIRFSTPLLSTILLWLQKNINNPKVCKDYPFTERAQREHNRKQIDLTDIWTDIPGSNIIPWSQQGTIFITPPGGGSKLHRDMSLKGPEWDDHMGLNFPIIVQDNLCQTYWVDDAVLKSHTDIEYITSHNVLDPIERFGRLPIARSVSLKTDEAMLVNTAIWHSWHNNSPHTRVIMSLRVKEDKKHWTFQRAQEALFVN